jgi:uncharacterized membrane protein YoaK (UPF0700 family)
MAIDTSRPQQPPSPLPWLLLLLSATTGLVDAVSVLGLGKVFTANMTGNVVFLGFATAGTPGFSWPPYVVAILTFMLGALVAGRLAKRRSGGPLAGWLVRAAFVEALLLWAGALVAIGFDPAAPDPLRTFIIIALTAIAMGFRNATIRQLKVPDLTTTVLTLTITGIAADSTAAGGANPNWARRLGAVAAIFAGALLGAVLVRMTGLTPPLALAGATVLAGTVGAARSLRAAHSTAGM